MTNTNVYFEDASNSDEWDKDMKKKCKCGHTLMMHGFTLQYSEYTQQSYLRVSGCVCCDCKVFESE